MSPSSTEVEMARPGQMSAADATRFFAAYDAVLDAWPVPVDAIEVASDYGRTHINACGPVDAPPLFLLHSGNATSTVWRDNVARLSRDYRVYAPDMIGEAGRSVRDGRRLTTTDDVVAWLDGLVARVVPAGSVYLAGHSYGAWIALNYTLRFPDRVAKLALIDPADCFAGLSPGYLLRGVPSVLWPSGRRTRRVLEWESAGIALDPQWLHLVTLAADVFPSSTVVRARHPDPASLRRCQVATLILLAQRSRCHNVATVAANAGKLMPQATTAVLPDVSHHSLPMRHPQQLDEALAGLFTP